MWAVPSSCSASRRPGSLFCSCRRLPTRCGRHRAPGVRDAYRRPGPAGTSPTEVGLGCYIGGKGGMTFRFTTAGESHGRGLVGILEGIPAGLPVSAADVDVELKRRMGGYGRGARMKIESDRIEWLAGVRAGETLGSPIAMLIWNRDWEHWQDVMAPEADSTPDPLGRRRQVTRPRPGHADLAGSLKYDRRDARDILERASARERGARVAFGAVCKRLLRELDMDIGSLVAELGGVTAAPRSPLPAPL